VALNKIRKLKIETRNNIQKYKVIVNQSCQGDKHNPSLRGSGNSPKQFKVVFVINIQSQSSNAISRLLREAKKLAMTKKMEVVMPLIGLLPPVH
jgi:hypothetical protein